MMSQAIQKANVLIEAMKWIREHRGKTTVIKLGGSLMQNEVAMMHFLTDVVFMETVGMRPVLVHGGGNAISQAMSDAGLEPKFVQGRRVTDAPSLEIVKKVLASEICSHLVEEIERYGGQGKVLSACFDTNVLYGEKMLLSSPDGDDIDLGFVGKVTRVDTQPIIDLCNRGVIPVIPSLTLVDDGSGQALNVNADTAATAVAQALKADKLVYVSEVNGVRTNPVDPNSMIGSLTEDEARELIKSGAIVGGMIPKIQGCLETIQQGVEKIHIINGSIRHALLLEIFTTQGVGTEITKSLRK